jgi:chromosome segregation ATPase
MLKASNRKFESFKKLMSSQTSRLTASLDKTSDKLELVTAANDRLKNTMHDKVLANQKLEDENKKLVKANTELKSDNQRLIKANSALRTDNKQLVKANTDLESVNHKINSKLDTEVQNNLIYKRRIDANVQKLDKNAKTISDLNTKYKTVMAGKTNYDQKISDLESKVDTLSRDLESSTKLIEEYQQAYANLCANTIGTHLSNIPVTASTSVQELQEYIYGSTNTSDVAVAPVIESPEVIDIDIDDNSEYSSSNVVIV